MTRFARFPSRSLFGHLGAFRRDLLATFSEAATHGETVWIRVLARNILLTSDPEITHQLLTSRTASKNTRGYQVLRRLLRDGLLTAEGELWRKHRRIAQPTFRRESIGAFAAVMAEVGEDGVRTLPDGEVDVARHLMRTTLRIAGLTLFSQDVEGAGREIGEAMDQLLHRFSARVLGLSALLPWLPTRDNRQMKEAVATLDRVVHSVIDAKRRGSPGDDLLGQFMSARDPETGEGMGDDQLRDEVLTLLLAGHETSANALAWTLHELSRHPEVQDAAAAEARAVAGDGPVTAELSRHLPLIDRILRESLRLHPPAWILSRRLEADEELGGELLPKGTYVFCPPYLVHRNPRHWPDPSRFDPDRFLQEPPAHAWIPFGDGPRRCIGEHFAMMELRIVLATWLRRARFLPGPGEVREDASVTLRPRGGLTLRVARRPM